jgi:hypothetical protein
MKRIATIVLGFVCFGTLSGVAGDPQEVNPYSVVLRQMIPAELPAKAADLIKRAQARDWSVTTVNVVKAALQANPASACAVVNSISKAAPEMAPVAAGTGAELQPKQAVAIAIVAAKAAPSKAARIVVAVSRAVPGSCRVVAVAVCEAVPGSNKAVLTALAAAFPELSAGIEKALASCIGELPSVGLALDQSGVVTVASSSTPTGARGPSIELPYILLPPGVTPHQAHNDPQNPVPPGPRSYGSATPP